MLSANLLQPKKNGVIAAFKCLWVEGWGWYPQCLLKAYHHRRTSQRSGSINYSFSLFLIGVYLSLWINASHLHSFTCSFLSPTSLRNLKELDEAFFPFDGQNTEHLFRPCRASECRESFIDTVKSEKKSPAQVNEEAVASIYNSEKRVVWRFDAEQRQWKAFSFNRSAAFLWFQRRVAFISDDRESPASQQFPPVMCKNIDPSIFNSRSSSRSGS